jgi:hypothetical protein
MSSLRGQLKALASPLQVLHPRLPRVARDDREEVRPSRVVAHPQPQSARGGTRCHIPRNGSHCRVTTSAPTQSGAAGDPAVCLGLIRMCIGLPDPLHDLALERLGVRSCDEACTADGVCRMGRTGIACRVIESSRVHAQSAVARRGPGVVVRSRHALADPDPPPARVEVGVTVDRRAGPRSGFLALALTHLYFTSLLSPSLSLRANGKSHTAGVLTPVR